MLSSFGAFVSSCIGRPIEKPQGVDFPMPASFLGEANLLSGRQLRLSQVWDLLLPTRTTSPTSTLDARVELVNAGFPEHTNFGSKLRCGYNKELCETQRKEGYVLCFLRKKWW